MMESNSRSACLSLSAGFAIGDLSLTYQMTGVLIQLFEVLEPRLGEPLTGDEVTCLTPHVARMVDDLRVR